MTVEEDDQIRARLTPGQKRDISRRHLDSLNSIAGALDRALGEIDLIIREDVVDNEDFHEACGVETALHTASLILAQFIARRALMVPRLRICSAVRSELSGIGESDPPRRRVELRIVT